MYFISIEFLKLKVKYIHISIHLLRHQVEDNMKKLS